jgi:hypothetical protein
MSVLLTAPPARSGSSRPDRPVQERTGHENWGDTTAVEIRQVRILCLNVYEWVLEQIRNS